MNILTNVILLYVILIVIMFVMIGRELFIPNIILNQTNPLLNKFILFVLVFILQFMMQVLKKINKECGDDGNINEAFSMALFAVIGYDVAKNLIVINNNDYYYSFCIISIIAITMMFSKINTYIMGVKNKC